MQEAQAERMQRMKRGGEQEAAHEPRVRPRLHRGGQAFLIERFIDQQSRGTLWPVAARSTFPEFFIQTRTRRDRLGFGADHRRYSVDRTRVSSIALAVLLTSGVASMASQDRDARAAAPLRRLLAPFGISVAETVAASAGGWRQIHLSWNRPGPAVRAGEDAPFDRKLAVLGERALTEVPARPRSLELGPGQVLVVALDAKRQLRSWSIVGDPRLLRAETTDAQGHWVHAKSPGVLAGGVGQRALARFSLEIPAGPGVTEIQVFEPRATGDELDVQLIATLALGGR